MEKLILDTLGRLEKEGFTKTAVEAAINTIEFSLRCGRHGRVWLCVYRPGQWCWHAGAVLGQSVFLGGVLGSGNGA